MDAELALVTLWGKGIEQIEDPSQRVPSGLINEVRHALGGATPRQMQQVSFWMGVWGLDRNATVLRLNLDYGVIVKAGARTLPSGALKRLTRASAYPRGSTSRQHTNRPDEVTDVEDHFELNLPGRKKAVQGIGVDEVLQVHTALAEAFRESGDPIQPSGVRDHHLLRSALHRPETGYKESVKYDTVEGHAAALMHSLVHNHPFHNGNKRTALVSMLVLLDRNGLLLTCNQEALFKHVLLVANHGLVAGRPSAVADREVQAIAEWIASNSRPIQHGDLNLTWRELRRILTRHGCTISAPMSGNRIRIERTVTGARKGILGRREELTLRFVAHSRSDGSDVGRSQLQSLRRELRFSEDDGYDSAHFYGSDRRVPDAFIAEYRSILRRLARL